MKCLWISCLNENVQTDINGSNTAIIKTKYTYIIHHTTWNEFLDISDNLKFLFSSQNLNFEYWSIWTREIKPFELFEPFEPFIFHQWQIVKCSLLSNFYDGFLIDCQKALKLFLTDKIIKETTENPLPFH